MSLPSLPELEAFVAVARHRSFIKAAAERGVSRSALSHTIRGLEERLGVRLLNRTTRSVALTEAGERLLRRLQPAFGDIAAALEEVDLLRGTPSGPLRLNVPRGATLVLEPLLARFRLACPQVRLEVATDDRLIDIVRDGFDAGIRFGESLDRDMIAIPIGGRQRFAVVGAPDYFASHGTPATPHDLRVHACIGRRFPGGAVYCWEFEKDGRALDVAVDGPVVLDDTSLMLRAAQDGLGLAFLYEQQAQVAINAGLLTRVLEDWCPAFPGFFLYYPSRRQMLPALRTLVDLLRAHQ